MKPAHLESKFKYLQGKISRSVTESGDTPREKFENIEVSAAPTDGNFIASNGRFVAVSHPDTQVVSL